MDTEIATKFGWVRVKNRCVRHGGSEGSTCDVFSARDDGTEKGDGEGHG
jgi:hypothetical protein